MTDSPCPRCANLLTPDLGSLVDSRGTRLRLRCQVCSWDRWEDVAGPVEVVERPMTGGWRSGKRLEPLADVMALFDLPKVEGCSRCRRCARGPCEPHGGPNADQRNRISSNQTHKRQRAREKVHG